MLYTFKLLLITISLFQLKYSVKAQYNKCRAPSISPENENSDGICVPRSECKEIFDIVKRNPKQIPPSIFIYLLKGDCGTHNGMRHLCCKIEYLSTETRTIIDEEQQQQEDKTVKSPFLRELRIATDIQNTKKDILKHPNIKFLPKDCQIIKFYIDDRISNADDAQLTEYRFIALMQYISLDGSETAFYCAGSLISPRYVLTAAHCKVDGIILNSVRLGELNTDKDVDCDSNECSDPVQDILVERIIIHENFNLETFSNDIALIRLKNKANLNVNNVEPICLPLYPELQNSNINEGIVIGWGSTQRHFRSSILQKAAFPIIERKKCKNFYRKYNIPILESHICAGGKNSMHACRGDSGGPLFTPQIYGNNSLPRHIQYGIVSGGTAQCGINNFPGLYTNVTYYLNWILDNIRN